MIYKCESCEKEFDEPEEIEESEKEYYDCLNGYLDKCCPYCKSANIYYRVNEMNKLNQEIINKIINNCKDEGTYVSQKEDQDFEVWEICFIDKDKEFKHFNVIHFYEYEDSKEYWTINLEEDSEIICAYYEAIEGKNDEYTLKDFHKEYDYMLETNREVMKLVKEFEGNILYC